MSGKATGVPPAPALAGGVSAAAAAKLRAILSHVSPAATAHARLGRRADGRASATRRCGSCVKQRQCAGAGGAVPPDIEEAAVCQGVEPGEAAARSAKSSADFGDRDPDWLFDPKRFAETQKPLLQASTLPRECYMSTRWYEDELQRGFLPSWTLLGREDEIEQPGEYLAVDTEWGGPVAACRGEDGRIYAYANVCCHRGAQVLQGERGRSASVGHVCPYHAWTYEFDGTLKWSPGMQQTQNYDEDEVRLTPIRVATFHGFIFVCVHPEAPELAEVLGDLPTQLAPWFGADGAGRGMVCADRREYTVECNWKFLMENTCETYHTSVVHKDSLGPMKATPQAEHVGDWDAVWVPSRRSIVPLPADFGGEGPLPAFTDKTAFVNLFPSLQINCTWDCMWWMRLIPTGPHQTRVSMGFCFPRPTAALPQFPAVLEAYKRRWHLAVSEDNSISLNQQRGVRSMFRKPGRFCQLEFGTHNFNNWLLSRVVPGAQPWDPGKRVFDDDNAEPAWSNDDPKLLAVISTGLATDPAPK